MIKLLEKQGKVIKKIRSELNTLIEAKINETIEKMSTEIKKQEKDIIKIKQLNEENIKTIKNQVTELENIKQKLEGIEGKFLPEQGTLKSDQSPENIKGVGPALGSELRMMGINTVGDFITTNPELIGEKTRISKDAAKNLQGLSQLMMNYY